MPGAGQGAGQARAVGEGLPAAGLRSQKLSLAPGQPRQLKAQSASQGFYGRVSVVL